MFSGLPHVPSGPIYNKTISKEKLLVNIWITWHKKNIQFNYLGKRDIRKKFHKVS